MSTREQFTSSLNRNPSVRCFFPAPQRKLGDELRAKKEGDDETFSTKDILRDVMRETFPELEARQLHALESLADQREDGRWGFANIEKWGFRTLQEVQDQHILLKSIKPPRGEAGKVESA